MHKAKIAQARVILLVIEAPMLNLKAVCSATTSPLQAQANPMARMNDFELFIVRHSDAATYTKTSDRERPLTTRGEEAMADAARGFAALGWTWSEAWTSPYLRTTQTAQIVRRGINSPTGNALDDVPEAKPLDALGLGTMDLDAAIDHILARGHRLQGPRPSIAVFTHQPIAQAMASMLLTGNTSLEINVSQGDVVHLLVRAPSHFDRVLAPVEKEPLTKAILLGVVPRFALERIGQGWHTP